MYYVNWLQVSAQALAQSPSVLTRTLDLLRSDRRKRVGDADCDVIVLAVPSEHADEFNAAMRRWVDRLGFER
jgi:predicted dinucleotide-binding enzyme